MDAWQTGSIQKAGKPYVNTRPDAPSYLTAADREAAKRAEGEAKYAKETADRENSYQAENKRFAERVAAQRAANAEITKRKVAAIDAEKNPTNTWTGTGYGAVRDMVRGASKAYRKAMAGE